MFRTEYDCCLSTSFQEGPNKKLLFDIKAKIYKKAKDERRLDEKIFIGNDPARSLMGTIFLVYKLQLYSFGP